MNLKAGPIYTIGYAAFPITQFIAVLQSYAIDAVCDVRSKPYSAYMPDYSQDALKRSLKESGINYVFLGLELGARREELECYVDGRVDYSKVQKTELFRRGIERLQTGMGKYTLTLLCAEKDPITCHRTILVARYLHSLGISVLHITQDGATESHAALEQRLLRLQGRDHTDLFKDESQLLCEAYTLQAEKIAFVREGED
jgi:uncharacterized protein (DUF488 family)